ncbi:class I SAM-dependent methyltransferase [Paenibacillus sp. OV219]|uniref:class I SAM-dependent methyltransferase n=1 Tax=Paenibacillus sp. OV219 TaxID=1884377 RepID=UPI0008B759B3|nr:class I SAM-dependent methyltransferase [Paenibacillus sp. OV219]SEO94779.1 Methyltransferase domain-containing protein [Paenibacillus sp. OV219]
MNQLTKEQFVSRFVREDDAASRHFVYSMPYEWWSRPYEYAWCSLFVEPTDTVLDAACGISHPFKFYLANNARRTYACDMDPRITSIPSILMEIALDIGEAAAMAVASTYEEGSITLSQAGITELPYDNQLFDKIFCISVLEHLTPADAILALKEFERTLHADGVIVVTLDYPAVNLSYFQSIVRLAGLEFYGPIDTSMTRNSLHTEYWGGIHCFRALLRKR